MTFTQPVVDLQGIFFPFQIKLDPLFAKETLVSAERGTEDLVAVPAHHFLPGISGNFFGGPVEIKDPPLQIVGDDPFPQAVQDIGEVVDLIPEILPGRVGGSFRER
jgi:hypothetical protein